MGIFDAVKNKTRKTSKAVTEALENENSKAALNWAKSAARTTGYEASRLGREIVRSDFVKDAAKGAAVGAVVAIPVPLIGPALGAAIGAGLGAYKNLSKPAAQKPQSISNNNPPTQNICEDLEKLDDLRQRGILTESEFTTQKIRLLSDSKTTPNLE